MGTRVGYDLISLVVRGYCLLLHPPLEGQRLLVHVTPRFFGWGGGPADPDSLHCTVRDIRLTTTPTLRTAEAQKLREQTYDLACEFRTDHSRF